MAVLEKTHSKNNLKYDEDISEIISNMMCIRMANRLYRDAVLILEYLINTHYVNNKEIVKYYVGSDVEGTAIFGSDTDNLFLHRDFLICQSKEEINTCKHDDVFFMDRTDCRPGYTKLKLINNKNDRFEQWEYTVVEYTEMGTYLSTNKFIDTAIQTLSKTTPSTPFNRHGPCVTMNINDFDEYRNVDATFPCKGTDIALGIEIRNITKEGKCWLKLMDDTQMKRIWPPAKTIQKIRTLRNEVVAVGFRDDTITDSPLKWRISYTMWERELVWSFHHVQIHCLVILKFLLKEKLTTISDDVTSYHLKNILFWETVDSSLEMFQNRQLLSWVTKCLIRLRMAINEKRLNHFIHRDRNLFLSKLKNEEARLKMIACLDELSKPHNFVLITLILDFLGDCNLQTLFLNYGSRPSEFQRTAVAAKVLRSGCIKKIMIYLNQGLNVSKIKYYVFYMRDVHIIRFWIDKLDDMEKLGVHNTFVKIARNVILTRNWLITAAKNADMTLPNEYFTDALSDRLYFCTYLIRYGRLVEAEGIISDFLKTCPKLLLYCGVYRWGDTYNAIHVEKGQANYTRIEKSSLDVSEDPFPFILDVIANPLEIDIFPPIIQIQSALEDRFIVLPPIVYMYYLKVVCDIRQHRNADNSLQRLSDTVNQYISKINEFRPLNMLGHAYLLTKRYEDAYDAFLESIRHTYPTKYPNSVFYLLLILVYHARYLA